MLDLTYFEIKELHLKCIREYDNIRKKKERIFKWLLYHKKILSFRQNYINPNDRIYYATFTFKSEKLNNNEFKQDSFIKYLIRNNVKGYWLNKDFGDDFQRIHLHGFIYTDKILHNDSINKYGWVKLKNVSKESIEEEESIVNYISNYVIKNNIFKNKCFTKYFENVYNMYEGRF